MKKINFTLFILTLAFAFSCTKQEKINPKNENKTESIEPILLDKAVLSGVGLQKVNLKDEPEKTFHQKRLYKGEEISVYVVSTETWHNKFKDFWFDEFIYMYNGHVDIKSISGEEYTINSGEFFFAPKGFTGDWKIKAGNNLHYELSVITNKRADSTKISEKLTHTVFNKEKLSGSQIDISAGNYQEILAKGLELTVTLNAEKPTKKENFINNKEQLIYVYSGLVELESEEKTHTFYTGDFFVLPNNYKGKWKSKGHGLVKYISVEKTKN